MNQGFKLLLVLIIVLIIPQKSNAGATIIEIGNIQYIDSLTGTVKDRTGAVMANVRVEEFDSKWNAAIRSTTSDEKGKFSFVPVNGRKIYYLQFSSRGMHSMRVRVSINKKKTKPLILEMYVAT